MLRALRASRSSLLSPTTKAFSTSRPVFWDVAKLTLVGRLAKDPEIRSTKNEKPYITYTVMTLNGVNTNQGGTRMTQRQTVPTYHRVLCFNPNDIDVLSRLKKGSKVFVQADYSIKEPEPEADPKSPLGQRHIFLTHDSLKILSLPRPQPESERTEAPETTL
ncbi:Single-stranded DNA-binding protein rim1, mitochondrial [Leucoagaricus sp. SymC.cos]|nr:Single-stranded DNA-binding protein rim1, mitochondrial [Leucoagaricus sp. SymC.cos]